LFVDREPLIVGLVVTLVSALVGYAMITNLRRGGPWPDLANNRQLDGQQRNAVRLRLQRDLDAVQVAASAIAFCGAAIVQEDGDTGVAPLPLIAISAAVPLAGTLFLLTRPAKWYDKYTFGLFTPLTTAFTALYVIALAWTALG
jgi:hypothetical protein